MLILELETTFRVRDNNLHINEFCGNDMVLNYSDRKYEWEHSQETGGGIYWWQDDQLVVDDPSYALISEV